DATDGDAAELEPPVAVVEQQDDLAVVERRPGGKTPAIALAPYADGDDRRLAVVDEGHGGAPRIGDDVGDVGRHDVARRPRAIPPAAWRSTAPHRDPSVRLRAPRCRSTSEPRRDVDLLGDGRWALIGRRRHRLQVQGVSLLL